MSCLIRAFLIATLAYQALTRVLWLYEARVHGTPPLARERLPYVTAFLADWCALIFAMIASALSPLSRVHYRASAGVRPVLLLHGYGVTRGAMVLLAARLRREGRDAYAYNYGGAREPEARAAHVAATLRELASHAGAQRVDVIAHGSAGVTVRSAARHHACADVLGNVVTLGAPHQGSALAAFSGLRALAHLRPRSRYLESLGEDDPVPELLNFTNIASTFDAVVFPPELAYYAGAMNVTLDWVGHYALLTSERIYRLAKENLDVEPKALRPS